MIQIAAPRILVPVFMLLAASAFPAPAHASEMLFSAPAECPDLPALRHEIAARLGREIGVDELERFSVRIERDGQPLLYRAVIATPEWSRSIDAPSCDEVLVAVATLLSVTVDDVGSSAVRAPAPTTVSVLTDTEPLRLVLYIKDVDVITTGQSMGAPRPTSRFRLLCETLPCEVDTSELTQGALVGALLRPRIAEDLPQQPFNDELATASLSFQAQAGDRLRVRYDGHNLARALLTTGAIVSMASTLVFMVAAGVALKDNGPDAGPWAAISGGSLLAFSACMVSLTWLVNPSFQVERLASPSEGVAQ